jgi:hypothetical protein
MFHHGFEWPLKERIRFEKQRKEWSEDTWFRVSTTGDRPWIIYMTDSFIEDWLNTIAQIIGAIGKFARKLVGGRRGPPWCWAVR